MANAKANDRPATRDRGTWTTSLAMRFQALTVSTRLTATMAIVLLAAALSRLDPIAALAAAFGGAIVAAILTRSMIRPPTSLTDGAAAGFWPVAPPQPAGANFDAKAA